MKKAFSTVSIDLGSELNDKRVMVWWYGAVIRNRRDGSQPKIFTLFREVGEDGSLLDSFYCWQVNVTSLGMMRIGTVWHGKRLVALADYAERTFDVDFSSPGWDFYTLGKDRQSDERYLIPPLTYPVFKRRPSVIADGWMIRFNIAGQSSLLVPCMEFYSRCYGVSQEIKRVLLTYRWQDAEQRLFGTTKNQVPDRPNSWTVFLGRDMRNNDAPFLAHVKHGQYARSCAKSVWAQMESANKDSPVFLKITPWNSGEGKIRVAGIDIPETKIFLALNVLAMSPPKSPLILLGRAGSNELDGQDKDTAKDDATDGVVRVLRDSTSGELLLAENDPPDHGTTITDLEESAWSWIGGPPRITPIPRRGNKGASRVIISDTTDDTVSAGERHGTGKGIGKAIIYAPILLESHGTLRDMWNAFQWLSEKHKDEILEVSFFTSNEEFQKDGAPVLIPFSALKNGDKGYAWTIIGSGKDMRRRGALVIRIRTKTGSVFVMEIERVMIEVVNKNGVRETKEEPFCGLVFRVKSLKELKAWVGTVMKTIPLTNGVFSPALLKKCVGSVDTFIHSKSKKDDVSCETPARNALRKMGIELKLHTQGT